MSGGTHAGAKRLRDCNAAHARALQAPLGSPERKPIRPSPSPSSCRRGRGGNDSWRACWLSTWVARSAAFVIDNRGGAAGTLARARSQRPRRRLHSHGCHSGVFGVAPSLYGSNAGYDPRKILPGRPDRLVPADSGRAPRCRCATSNLVALARKEPGKLTYATAGIGSGSHVSTELFNAMAEIKLTHIPYRGSGPAQSDLIAGHVRWQLQQCHLRSRRFAAAFCAHRGHR